MVSLITCIPLELACETIVNLLDNFAPNFPSTVTIEMLEHYQSKYFLFSNCYYQQVKTVPMGSPISGLIDETVLQRLGRFLFAVIAPKFRKRYANDTFFIIMKDQVPSFHQLLNTSLPGIEFTMEEPTNDRFPFLDVLVQKLPSGDFETSIYRKEMNADVDLNLVNKPSSLPQT